MALSFTRARRAGVLKVLGHKKARAELVRQLRAKYGLSGQLGDGTILKLLLEHSDEILAIIAAIIKMFGL